MDSPIPNCFQRTYEELKLFLSALVVASVVSFQRTYEELKLGGRRVVMFDMASFQRTYEELKQTNIIYERQVR